MQNIEYLGNFIDGERKKELYLSSHIFCLPTYYPYEGQPISILEAYATGCVVITTPHGGIPDIFVDQKNGFLVESNDIGSLKQVLFKILAERSSLEQIALNNTNEVTINYLAERYKQDIASVFSE